MRVREKRLMLPSKKIITAVAVFALIAQPLYGLVAGQVANALTAAVTDQASLEEAIANPTTDTIQLQGSFSVDKKVSINRPLTLNGGSNTITSTRNNNPNNNSNNAVLGIDATAGVTINNLTVARGAGLNIHGINVWRSTAVLNDVTVSGFNNGGVKYGLIVGENSTVTAHNIATIGNSRGINVDGGTPKLIVTGASSHSETNAIYVDANNSTRVDDVSSQYIRTHLTLFGFHIGHTYALKTAPLAPSITSPSVGSTVSVSSISATWSAAAASTTTQAAVRYEYRLDGGVSESTTSLSAPLVGLTNGSHTFEVRAVAASGLVSAWSVSSFTVAIPDSAKPVVTLVSPVAGGVNPPQITVDATDETSLYRVTANIYNEANTTLLHSCSEAANGAAAYTLACDVPALADGLYTIRANAQDNASPRHTSSTITRQFRIDSTAPSVYVKGQGNDWTPTSLGQGTTFREVSFKFSDAGQVDRVTLNEVDKDLGNSTWSDLNSVKPGVYGAVEGENTLKVYDVAGNVTTIIFTLDTTKPSITLLAPVVANQTNTPTISGTAEQGAVVRIFVNGVEVHSFTATSTDWSYTFETALADEDVISASARDVAGNETAGDANLRTVYAAYVAAPPVVVAPPVIAPQLPAAGNGPIPVLNPAASTAQAAATPAALFFGNATTDEAEDSASILGAQDSRTSQVAGAADTVAVSATENGWKVFGLLWYWWLLIIAALVGLWWIIAAARRRKNDEDA